MSIANGLKTIIVATDLKGSSAAALEYARKIAAAYGARIVLAHGVDPLEYAAIGNVPDRVREELTDEARAALDAIASTLLTQGISANSEIRQGTVVDMLASVARQYDAGLIVLGTKGAEGAGPVVVGALAEQLVRQAPCAVLAVAADWNAGEHRPTPGGPVLLAIEHNETTAAAVATAWSLAKKFTRPLLLLHAHPEGPADPCAVSYEQYGLVSTDEVPVRCLVREGDPVEVTAEAIAETRPSVLVVGAKRVSESAGPHGTAFVLLARSRVPVLCVPPDTDEVTQSS